MDPRLKRTEYAEQAASLADQFQAALASHVVSGHRIEMTAPEASTGGGVQALQHIRLVRVGAQGPTYVIGNANRILRVAELRTLDYVDQVSLERFGARTGLDPADYATAIAAAARFLEQFGLRVTHATRALSLRPGAARERARPRGFSPLAVAVILLWSIGILAVGLAVGVLATRGRLGH